MRLTTLDQDDSLFFYKRNIVKTKNGAPHLEINGSRLNRVFRLEGKI